jgi:Zn finger protein HypA/HybF involved in hydrogenase expression
MTPTLNNEQVAEIKRQTKTQGTGEGVVARLISTLEAAQSENAKLSDLVYAKCQWHCPKCKFTLVQSTLHAANGVVSARDEAGSKCPNCDSPLWRVSWKQEANEMMNMAENLLAENAKLREALKKIECEIDSPARYNDGVQNLIDAALIKETP